MIIYNYSARILRLSGHIPRKSQNVITKDANLTRLGTLNTAYFSRAEISQEGNEQGKGMNKGRDKEKVIREGTTWEKPKTDIPYILVYNYNTKSTSNHPVQ